MLFLVLQGLEWRGIEVRMCKGVEAMQIIRPIAISLNNLLCPILCIVKERCFFTFVRRRDSKSRLSCMESRLLLCFEVSFCLLERQRSLVESLALTC